MKKSYLSENLIWGYVIEKQCIIDDGMVDR